MVKKMVPEGALPAIYRRAQDPRRSARLITLRVTRGTALIVALVLSRGRGAPKPPSPSRRPVPLSLGVPGSVAPRWSRASAPQEDDGIPPQRAPKADAANPPVPGSYRLDFFRWRQRQDPSERPRKPTSGTEAMLRRHRAFAGAPSGRPVDL